MVALYLVRPTTNLADLFVLKATDLVGMLFCCQLLVSRTKVVNWVIYFSLHSIIKAVFLLSVAIFLECSRRNWRGVTGWRVGINDSVDSD